MQASVLETRYWSGDRARIDALRHSMEAVRTGEEQEDENTKDDPEIAGSGAVQIRCSEQPALAKLGALLRFRNP